MSQKKRRVAGYGWQRRLLMPASAAVVFFICSSFCSAHARDLTFFVTGDLHYSSSTASNNAINVQAINTIGATVASPRGVLVAGDLTDNGFTGEWNQFAAAYPLEGGTGTGQIHYPVYEITGNHDREWYSYGNIPTRVTERHGSLPYSWDWDGVHLVSLDLYPSSSNTAWLASDLASLAFTTPVVIMTHYGYDSYSQTWWDDFSSESAAFLNAINQHNVVALLHGHIHESSHYLWQGYDVYTPGSPKESDYGFGKMNIGSTSLTWTRYSWNTSGAISLDWTHAKTFAPEYTPGPDIENGDFENTDGWGALGSVNMPAGWLYVADGTPDPNVSGSPGNMAVEQSGGNAIGGSGTSAYIPFDASATGWRQLIQPITDAETVWRFDMDFATVDPQASRSMTLYLAGDLSSTKKTVLMRVVSGSESGYGTLEIYQSGWKTFGDLENSIVLDDDVTVTPLTHHLKVVGDYSLENPIYDVYLTDANGVEHSATGLDGFYGTAVAQGDTIKLVRCVQYNNHPSIPGYDYLIDNVSLSYEFVPGDANRDGKVDAADAEALAAHWLQSENVDWTCGDFNEDGRVDEKDASLLACNWGRGVDAAAVPEPATIILLIAALAVLCGRKYGVLFIIGKYGKVLRR